MSHTILKLSQSSSLSFPGTVIIEVYLHSEAFRLLYSTSVVHILLLLLAKASTNVMFSPWKLEYSVGPSIAALLIVGKEYIITAISIKLILNFY